MKKAECRRIDAFELWCWRRLLRVPWTARRSNQSILKKISPEYSLEGLMLKLKLQYFGHLMWRTDSFEKTLMLEKIEGRRRRGQQRIRWLHDITSWMDMSLGKLREFGDGQEGLACLSPWSHKESDTTERLNWTEHPDQVVSIPVCSEFSWLCFCYQFCHYNLRRTLANQNAQIIWPYEEVLETIPPLSPLSMMNIYGVRYLFQILWCVLCRLSTCK